MDERLAATLNHFRAKCILSRAFIEIYILRARGINFHQLLILHVAVWLNKCVSVSNSALVIGAAPAH